MVTFRLMPRLAREAVATESAHSYARAPAATSSRKNERQSRAQDVAMREWSVESKSFLLGERMIARAEPRASHPARFLPPHRACALCLFLRNDI
jgi:hypothetical protein